MPSKSDAYTELRLASASAKVDHSRAKSARTYSRSVEQDETVGEVHQREGAAATVLKRRRGRPRKVCVCFNRRPLKIISSSLKTSIFCMF